MNCSCFITVLVWFLLHIVGVHGISPAGVSSTTNNTFQPYKKLQNLKMIKARLKRINKSPLKTIQVNPSLQSYKHLCMYQCMDI